MRCVYCKRQQTLLPGYDKVSCFLGAHVIMNHIHTHRFTLLCCVFFSESSDKFLVEFEGPNKCVSVVLFGCSRVMTRPAGGRGAIGSRGLQISRVGSGRVVFKLSRSGQVTSGRTRPARFDLTRQQPCFLRVGAQDEKSRV